MLNFGGVYHFSHLASRVFDIIPYDVLGIANATHEPHRLKPQISSVTVLASLFEAIDFSTSEIIVNIQHRFTESSVLKTYQKKHWKQQKKE